MAIPGLEELFKKLPELASKGMGGAVSQAAGASSGLAQAGQAVGQGAAADALKAGGGLSFGKASVPGIAQGAAAGVDKGQRLSEAMKMSGAALKMGGMFVKNPEAKKIMGLMSGAMGAAGETDPAKSLEAIQGAVAPIAKQTQEEEAAKQKRLTESLQPKQSLLDRQKEASTQAAPPPTAAGPPPATSLLPPGGGGQNLPSPNDRLSTFGDSTEAQQRLIERLRGGF